MITELPQEWGNRLLDGRDKTLCMPGARDQDHPHGKEMQKSKMAVWGGLTNSCEKKRGEKTKEKRKDISI